ncbi:hypothetical protein C8A01DRAFT_39405 [Parachaetomium inaequale]|uniref:Uncharacterized protein n=1 Tax=Parachaetomium inaequale TaxID=2588326 RepID=A0AAN6PB72_9PEZI|nr:hypothetical protein C8A01DRAFT_39405 [Parachaetomium inaequale]
MSGLPKNLSLLVDWFPRAGFLWRRGQGSPRILRSDFRDAVVRRAIAELLGDGGAKIRKRDAQDLVANALAVAAKTITDPEAGIRPEEGIIDFLERAAKFADLSQAIPENIWVELVYQIARARYEYECNTPAAQKKGDEDRLTGLAHAIDDLVDGAGQHWDWTTLELYAYPHLMGEAADYEIDDSDNDDNAAAEDEEMADDEAEKMLPRRMEQLTIKDADGDVEMEL